MAVSTPIVVLKLFHVIGAMVVVGYFALLPMWKASATRSGDAGVIRHFLASGRSVEQRVVLPALVLVLLTGLALTLGPFAIVRLSVVQWPQAAVALTAVLLLLLVAGLGGPSKKMLALAEKGEATGPAMDKLWGEWRTALLAGALLALVATGMMVYQASL